MQLEAELAKFSPKKGMLLTIGVFDGVHLGHRHLLSKLTGLAQERGLLSGVVTFSDHPRGLLAPRTKLPFLTDIEQRTRLLKNEGVDEVIPLSFTPELAKLSPKEFLGRLQELLKMQGLVVGPDFALGKGRRGNIETLRKLGAEMGFSFTVVPPRLIDGEKVSSTAIRKALAEGDMERAQKLFGHPFRLHGRVARGERRGIELLGFPTANIDTDVEQALPADGVYASQAFVGDKSYPAMTNIGSNPTFGGDKRLVEVYILDYDKDLYGQELAVDVLSRLRDEIKFASAEALKAQITEDVKKGKAILNTRGVK
ncbi:MAG: bifunctional riboflavin kinase/FAD synthetase [Dehalococcoidia bacterium]|jgi:riboflavin kinase/FMN adenylyltransferase